MNDTLQTTAEVIQNVEPQTLSNTLLEGMSIILFISFLIYSYLGILVNMLVEFMKRKPLSPSSPNKPDFKYYWKDNKVRIFIALILSPIAIILCKNLINIEISNMVAFFIGYCSDQIAEMIKRKTSTILPIENSETTSE